MLRLARNSAALFLAKAAALGTRILALLAIAKLCPEREFAQVAFVIALAEMFRLLADWGTETWIVRAIAIAADSDERARIFKAAMGIKVMGGGIAAAAILAISVGKYSQDGIALGISAVVLLASSQITVIAIAYFQAADRIRTLAVLAAPCAFTAISVILAVLLFRNSLVALAVLATGELLTASLLLALLRREGLFVRPYVDAPAMKNVARACLPVAVFGIVLGIYSRLDTIILAQFSVSALAIYTVANRMFQPFQVAVTSLGSVIYSSTSSELAANRPRGQKFYREELLLTFGLALAASAMLWILGVAVIKWFLPAYLEALSTLRVLCGLLVVLAFSSAIAARVLAYGHFGVILAIAAIDLTCTGAGMIMLVPREGSTGAAYALLFGAVVNCVLTFAFAQLTIDRARSWRLRLP